MSPYHPKLRNALLNDKEHQKAGLTASLLLTYENIEHELFEHHYYKPHKNTNRDRFMINPDSIKNMRVAKPELKNWDDVIALLEKNQMSGIVYENYTAFTRDLRNALVNQWYNEYSLYILKHTRVKENETLTVTAFKEKYMPNFDKVHNDWHASQKRAFRKRTLDVGLRNTLSATYRLITSVLKFK